MFSEESLSYTFEDSDIEPWNTDEVTDFTKVFREVNITDNSVYIDPDKVTDFTEVFREVNITL